MMRNRLGQLIVGLAAALLSGCATTMAGHSDFDRTFRFEQAGTFHWLSDDPLIRAEGIDPDVGALNVRRIVTAIETELRAKGFMQAVDRESADFVVSFTVGARDRIDVMSFPQAYRGPWFWQSMYWGDTIVRHTYREGRLAIDIFDQDTRQPVWHGWVTRRISDEDRDNAEVLIREAVSAILADFPPRTE